jgi:hypothetical protein
MSLALVVDIGRGRDAHALDRTIWGGQLAWSFMVLMNNVNLTKALVNIKNIHGLQVYESPDY